MLLKYAKFQPKSSILPRIRSDLFFLHMHAKPSFAHRLQTAKMGSFRTSAQNNGPRAQNNGPRAQNNGPWV